MPPGLRERKNERTRVAITRAALELTLEQGFEATTVAQIAARADVSPRTVFTWFPAKDDIVFPRARPPLDRLRAALAGGDGDAMDRLERWLDVEAADALATVDDVERLRFRAMTTDPYLRDREHGYMREAEQLLADAFATDAGRAPEDLAPRALAAAAIALLLGVRERFFTDVPDPEEQLRQGLEMLRGGLSALRSTAAGGPGPPGPPAGR